MSDSGSTEPASELQGHTLGFGCASLYGLPAKRDRRAVLEFAYDLGIRHFDVAPIYGLGIAEAELGEFAQTHTDIRIATKFGMRPTPIGRFAGLIQPPIRRILQTSSAVKSKVKQSGGAAEVGVVSRILYSPRDYSVANARHSLVSSLRALRTERIDYFLLHEPAGALADDIGELVDYLETERGRGVIGRWGPAGDPPRSDDPRVAALSARASAFQFPYDLIAGYGGPSPEQEQPHITFGILAETLPRVRTLLTREPEFRERCSDLLGADLADPRTVVKLLVRDAVTNNQGGTVLVSSTNIKNLEMVYAGVNATFQSEAEVASMIRDRCLAMQVAQ